MFAEIAPRPPRERTQKPLPCTFADGEERRAYLEAIRGSSSGIVGLKFFSTLSTSPRGSFLRLGAKGGSLIMGRRGERGRVASFLEMNALNGEEGGARYRRTETGPPVDRFLTYT